MGIHRALVALVAAVVIPAVASLERRARAEPPAPDDWLVADLKTQVVENGAIGWKRFGIGSTIALRTADARMGSSETRTTLVRREKDATVFKGQGRKGDGAWSEPGERRLAGGPVEGAERKVEDLGKEAVDVGGTKVECAKERWTRVVKGTATKPEIVVWRGAAGALVQWQVDLGDAWLSTYTVLRDDVEWRLGDRALRCREIHRVDVRQGGGFDMSFDRTGLWSSEVPEHVVRWSTKGKMGPGPAQEQTTELTELDTKPEEPPSATPQAPAAAPK